MSRPRKSKSRSKKKTKKRPSAAAAKGRALEQLIARLEAVAATDSTTVTSPDSIMGIDSKSIREVDVTVRSKVGNSSVLVMLECRNRAVTNDVRWIEQIATKRDDVGADVAVAVAADGGFSEGARNMAAKHRIELRTVQDISIEDVASWCRLTGMQVALYETRNPDVEMGLWGDCPPLACAPSHDPLSGPVTVSLDEPVFTLWDARNRPVPTRPEWGSAGDLHDLAMKFYHEDEALPRFADWTKISLSMSSPELPLVAIKTTEGPFPLLYFNALAEVRLVESEVPLTFRSVTNSQGDTTQVVEAVTNIKGQDVVVALVNNGGEIAAVTSLPEGPATPAAGAVALYVDSDALGDGTG